MSVAKPGMVCVALALLGGCQTPRAGELFSRNQPRERPGTADVTTSTESRTADVDPANALDLGHEAENEGRLQEAKQHYAQAVESPHSSVRATAHHRLAVIADKQQDFALAEQHYRRAVEEQPNDADLLSDFGFSYLLQGRYRLSEDYLQQALAAVPGHKLALNNLGLLYGKMGDRERALATFRKIGSEAQAQARLAKQFPNDFPTSPEQPESAARPNGDVRPVVGAFSEEPTSRFDQATQNEPGAARPPVVPGGPRDLRAGEAVAAHPPAGVTHREDAEPWAAQQTASGGQRRFNNAEFGKNGQNGQIVRTGTVSPSSAPPTEWPTPPGGMPHALNTQQADPLASMPPWPPTNEPVVNAPGVPQQRAAAQHAHFDSTARQAALLGMDAGPGQMFAQAAFSSEESSAGLRQGPAQTGADSPTDPYGPHAAAPGTSPEYSSQPEKRPAASPGMVIEDFSRRDLSSRARAPQWGQQPRRPNSSQPSRPPSSTRVQPARYEALPTINPLSSPPNSPSRPSAGDPLDEFEREFNRKSHQYGQAPSSRTSSRSPGEAPSPGPATAPRPWARPPASAYPMTGGRLSNGGSAPR